ncbi:MAG: EAL domain-containing protein [Gallionellaceae bacterium]|nr:EAL domain-containing protein [Gallionellaceae bacterium]
MVTGEGVLARFQAHFKTHILRIGMLALAYFVTAQIGLELPLVGRLVGLFWPPSGIALAALLLFGVQLWPGILLGALASNLISGLPFLAAFGISVGAAGEAALGAYLLNRYSRFNIDLHDVYDIFRLLFWGAVVSTLIGAASGGIWLARQEVIDWQEYVATFKFWWMGDMLGVVLFAPALIFLFRPKAFAWTPESRKKAIMLYLAVMTQCLMVFTDFGITLYGYPLKAYMLFPFIVWAAFGFDLLVIGLTLLMMYFSSCSSIGYDSGVCLNNTPSEAADVWTYNILLSLAGLIMLVAGEHRNRVKKEQLEKNLHALSFYDVLTGLPNRTLLHDRIAQLLATAQRDGQKFSLLFLNLDRFKYVNISIGHGAGDKLLQAVALRLKRCIREVDTLSRNGGDEFILLLREADADGAARVTQRLLKISADPYDIDDAQISVQASIGISIYPDNAEDVDTLIENANVAMYRAKEEGRNNFQFFAPEMNFHAYKLFSMEKDLRLALARNEFMLHYQPQVNVASGQICGVEALIRWNHPQKGLVSPAEFIPVAEETGQIIPIGVWVLRTACTQLAAWRKQGIPVFPMAVNVSIRQLRQMELVQLVVSILEETGLRPDDLELEITEGIMMGDNQTAMTLLSKMHELGVQLSIDDFGTGYSSLNYLKKLPVNKLKIDQSFVRDIEFDDNDASIVRSIISMGHQFNLQVIAEGVETLVQLNFLRARGCDEIQGYYFSRPIPADEFMKLVKSNPLLS